VNGTIRIEAFYQIFRDISTSIHSSTDIKEVLDLVVRKSTEVVNAKGAILRVLNLETNELEFTAAHGLSKEYLSKDHVASRDLITDLCRQKKVVIIQDAQTDSRVQFPREAEREGIRMMLDFPLVMETSLIGILRIFSGEKREFSDEELEFLLSISEQCALAADKAYLIEKQKSQYDQLALQTEKMSALGRMSAGIAHEINNPLAGILLFSTRLLKKAPKQGPFKEGLDVIVHETMRCKDIIQGLLEFSREGEPKKSLSSVNKIMEKALAILENEFHLRHIVVEKTLADNMPSILMDANQIEQVLVNLLLNAAEAIEDGGKIAVESCMDPGIRSEIIKISDTGDGMLPEQMDRIFEPFFSTKSKGTGLGLTVSYGIVRNHGGRIGVSSTPGTGTCFTIKFPVDLAAASIGPRVPDEGKP